MNDNADSKEERGVKRGKMKREAQDVSKELNYRFGFVPRRLRKLYWHGPLQGGICLGSALFLIFISVVLAERFQVYDWKWLLFPLVGELVFLGFFLRYSIHRKNRLEAEVLEGLPEGWHLVYVYRFLDRRYRPELVFGGEFDRMLNQKSGWYRMPSGYIADIEKQRLKRGEKAAQSRG